MARILLCRHPDVERPVLDVALSETNLVALYSKLFTPGSRCALASGDVPDAFAYAVIRSEPDDYHYASPTRDGAPRGPMHPLAELVRTEVRRIVEAVIAAQSNPAGGGGTR